MGTVIDRQVYESAEIIDRELFISDERAALVAIYEGEVPPVVQDGLELAGAVRVALDDGCSLAELEATVLVRADTVDQVAAAWLYAWAYDRIRPRHNGLATQITSLTCRLPRTSHRPDAVVPHRRLRCRHLELQ